MRKIVTLLALFSLAAAFGQSADTPAAPASGREPARPRTIPVQRFDLPAEESNSYLRPVTWRPAAGSAETRFEADCSIPFAWANRQVLLRIASAPAGYELTVNGRRAGHVRHGALPAEFNLTKLLREGSNRLELRIPELQPDASLDDFAHPATGIGVSELISQPTIRIRDCFVITRPVDGNYLAEVGIVVKSDALNRKQARIHYDLKSPSGLSVKSGFEDIALSMRGEDTLRFTVAIPENELWSPDTPTRYRLQLRTQTAGRYTEHQTRLVGFRTIEMRDGELLLNGRPVELRLGTFDGTSLTATRLENAKYGGTTVLLPLPGPVDESLYDLCDELGMLLIAQTPLRSARSGESRRKGGNPTNDPAHTPSCIDRTESAYRLSQYHPSVIGFSLARDASNGIGLYESYLNLKRLEEQRPIFYPEAGGEWNSDPMRIIEIKSID